MISDLLLNDVALYVKEKIVKAEVVFEGKEPEEVGIIRKDLKNNILKVFVNTTKGKGVIKDVRLLDEKGNVLINKPRGTIKTLDHAIVSTYYIKFMEEEIDDPINIFEIKEGING